jgi:hypothetical protein
MHASFDEASVLLVIQTHVTDSTTLRTSSLWVIEKKRKEQAAFVEKQQQGHKTHNDPTTPNSFFI